MRALRIILKILLFPITLILTLFVAVSGFIIEKCAMLLNIISGLLFLLAALGYVSFLAETFIPDTAFGSMIGMGGMLVPAVTMTVAGFIISPYGLPQLAAWLIDKLDDLNIAIKSI